MRPPRMYDCVESERRHVRHARGDITVRALLIVLPHSIAAQPYELDCRVRPLGLLLNLRPSCYSARIT